MDKKCRQLKLDKVLLQLDFTGQTFPLGGQQWSILNFALGHCFYKNVCCLGSTSLTGALQGCLKCSLLTKLYLAMWTLALVVQILGRSKCARRQSFVSVLLFFLGPIKVSVGGIILLTKGG